MSRSIDSESKQTIKAILKKRIFLWMVDSRMLGKKTTEGTITGSRFSKVPKLFGLFSGVKIRSVHVSYERRDFKSSNFTIILLFVILKPCQKNYLSKQANGSFLNGFLDPRSFGTFEKRDPGIECTTFRFLVLSHTGQNY